MDGLLWVLRGQIEGILAHGDQPNPGAPDLVKVSPLAYSTYYRINGSHDRSTKYVNPVLEQNRTQRRAWT